jgi:1-acyl-sn-glycerol-3-phosphate acyltransferase
MSFLATRLRLVWVLFAAIFLVLRGYLTMLLLFPFRDAPAQQALTQSWARDLLRLFRVEVEITGAAPQTGPVLLAANHISWLDILLLLAACPAQFVARVENKNWPILGRMTRQSGAVFVARQSSRDMARAIAQVSASLADEAAIIAFFPEGKTSNGAGVEAFHGNLLQAAIAAACPVQAVALDYRLRATGARSTAVTYANPLTLWQSLLNTLEHGPYTAQVRFADAISSSGQQRKHLAAALRQQVLAMREG